MTIKKILASSCIKGQYPVELYELDCKMFAVGYGSEWAEFDTINEALNNYNQCNLHAETCAGFHN